MIMNHLKTDENIKVSLTSSIHMLEDSGWAYELAVKIICIALELVNNQIEGKWLSGCLVAGIFYRINL